MTGYRVKYYPGGVTCYHEDCRKAQTESQPGVYIQPVPPMPMREWVCMNHFGQYINDGLLEETGATPKMTHHTLTKEAYAQTCTTCEEQETRVRVDDEATCIACLADMTDDGAYALVSTDDGYALAPPKKKEAPDTRSILAGIEVAW